MAETTKKMSLSAFAATRKTIPFHRLSAAAAYFKEQGFQKVPGHSGAWRCGECSAIWLSVPGEEPAGYVIMRGSKQ